MSVRCLMIGFGLVVFASRPAMANGGPSRLEFVATGRGGISPMKVRDIRLVSEDLQIAFDDDGNHYHVMATYTLSNAHAPRRIAFGVPLGIGYPLDELSAPRDFDAWTVAIADGHMSGLDHPRVRRAIAAAIKSVRVSVGGRQSSCALVRGPKQRVRLRKELDDIRMPPMSLAYQPPWMEDPEGMPLPSPPNAFPIGMDGYRKSVKRRKTVLDMSESLSMEAWCAADLVVPSGEAIPLTLRYRGALEHWPDWTEVGSQLTQFGPRYLRYELWPAGYWGGPVRNLSITVSPGPYRGLVLARQPAGHVIKDGRIIWNLQNVDLATSGALLLRVDARPLLRGRVFARWNSVSGQKLSLRRSSPVGSAERALDGIPKTAWCPTSKPASGLAIDRVWLEYELLRPPRLKGRNDRARSCELEGVVVVTQQRNLAPVRLRVGDCGSEAGTDVLLPRPKANAVTWILLFTSEDREKYNAFYQHRFRFDRDTQQQMGTVPMRRTSSLLRLIGNWTRPFKKASSSKPCMRLTLDGWSDAGAVTCLSEVAPVFDACN